jgi:hypothetical protein
LLCRSRFAGLSTRLEVLDALRVRLWLHDLDLGILNLGIVETLPSVDSACFEQSVARKRSRTPPAA